VQNPPDNLPQKIINQTEFSVLRLTALTVRQVKKKRPEGWRNDIMFAGPLVPRSLGEACCADYMLRHTYAVPVPSPRLAIASVGKRKEAQRRKTIVSNYDFLILGSECGAAALFVTRNASSRSRRRRSCLSSNPTSCLGPYVAYFILLARRDVPRCITVL
jgi:hypothetical protein